MSLAKGHRYQTFEATGGIDNGGSDQKGGKDSSVQFFVSDKPSFIKNCQGIPEIPQVDHFPPDQLVVPEGLEVKLWAKSPLFYNPTNMDIDHKGRVWVAEGRNYRGRKLNRKVTGLSSSRTKMEMEWRKARMFSCRKKNSLHHLVLQWWTIK